MFWWLGLPEPLLWGVIMGLLAVVPVLGAFIVWMPAALFLGLEGSVGKALLLTLWGAVVVGGIDNLLYPILVGTRLKLHSVVAFVSIVGGFSSSGPPGSSRVRSSSWPHGCCWKSRAGGTPWPEAGSWMGSAGCPGFRG